MQLTNSTVFRAYTAAKLQVEAGPSPAKADSSSELSSSKPRIEDAPAEGRATKTAAQTAREKVDADYAKAAKGGDRIVADVANGGRFLDLSSLSDEELAAVATGKGFSGDESLTAKAALADRMWAALSPFDGDPRGSALAIKAIYPSLSQSVRDALGWNQSMLDMGERIVRGSGAPEGDKETKSIFDKIAEGQRSSGALKVDSKNLGLRGRSVDLSA